MKGEKREGEGGGKEGEREGEVGEGGKVNLKW